MYLSASIPPLYLPIHISIHVCQVVTHPLQGASQVHVVSCDGVVLVVVVTLHVLEVVVLSLLGQQPVEARTHTYRQLISLKKCTYTCSMMLF